MPLILFYSLSFYLTLFLTLQTQNVVPVLGSGSGPRELDMDSEPQGADPPPLPLRKGRQVEITGSSKLPPPPG